MNETQRKALLLLGLARKARKLEIGEEPCGIACRSGKAKLLLIAHDAGDHTFRRARSYCRAGKPPYLCVPFTKDELGDASTRCWGPRKISGLCARTRMRGG